MNIVSTYTWCQFTPAFALVGLAALLILADALLPRLPKRIYAFVGAMGTFVAAYFLATGEQTEVTLDNFHETFYALSAEASIAALTEAMEGADL